MTTALGNKSVYQKKIVKNLAKSYYTKRSEDKSKTRKDIREQKCYIIIQTAPEMKTNKIIVVMIAAPALSLVWIFNGS